MWSVLKERLKEAHEGQQTMQIHQDPVLDHAVAHAEAEVILSASRSEFATTQHLQADWELTPPDPGHEGPYHKEPDSQMFLDLIQEDRL